MATGYLPENLSEHNDFYRARREKIVGNADNIAIIVAAVIAILAVIITYMLIMAGARVLKS